MTQAARDALRRVGSVLADNAEPLKSGIANLQVFTERLARNTGKLDNIVAGLEKMTGSGPSAAPKFTYDLRAAQVVAVPSKTIKGAIGDSGAHGGCDARDAANAVLAGQRRPGIRGFSLGRRHSEATAGPIDRELRELRYRSRAVAHGGYRTGKTSSF
jgi:ABC-type transporter Mla subunit MlaD